MAQSNPSASDPDTGAPPRNDLEIECGFCNEVVTGQSLTEDRESRTLRTSSCGVQSCGKGQVGLLVISGSPRTAVKRELDSRRDQLRRGLSPRRVAAAVRYGHGAGTYTISKTRPHTYEIRGGDAWNPNAIDTLASTLRELADHIETKVTDAGQTLTVTDTRFSSPGERTPPRTDGGRSPAEQHRAFQRRRQIGQPDVGDRWPERL
jgi:hypothetical protein